MRPQMIVLLVVALVVGSLLPAAAQPVAQAISILPGKNIGPIEIGMPLDRAREIMAGWGPVEAYEGTMGHGVCNPERGVGACVFDRWDRLNLNTPGLVVFALTDDARFATVPGGHKVGGPLLDLLRTFGLYSGGADTELRWEGYGLAADIRATQGGLVVQVIGVYTPRTVASRLP